MAGWLVQLALLGVVFVRDRRARPALGLLALAIVLASSIGLLADRYPLLDQFGGLIQTLLLIGALAVVVLRTRLFTPTRAALDLAIQAMSEAVAVLDRDAKVIYANPQATSLGLWTGHTVDAALRGGGADPYALANLLAQVQRIERGAPQILTIDERRIELSSAPVSDPRGRPLGTLLLGRDVTELERRNVMLEQERGRLADSVRALEAGRRERAELVATVAGLSLPLIPVLDGVLVLPLVGPIDSGRIAEFTRVLLGGIERERARLVLIDVTGVPLLDEVAAAGLLRGVQAILFLNRRGAAAFVMCRDCGHVIACPNCSSPLVVHYENDERRALNAEQQEPPSSFSVQPSSLLMCHSCSHRELVPTNCPECWSPRIKSFGVGTQRVVEEVAALFPEARSLRWDRDSVGRKGDHERMLDHFLRHDADVLVGTQMIAKGLDLPLVSVVGVVAADTGLHLPDFRAGERTFQLLTQVAGRAGRRSAGAQVVLQTYAPEHYALQAAQEHDYAGFYTQEIAFRRQTGYPPFSRLVRFVYAGGSDERAERAAHELAETIRQVAAGLELGEWGIIGPAPAFFHRQRNRYRWHVLLRAADPQPLLEALRTPPGWALDVDPVHVL